MFYKIVSASYNGNEPKVIFEKDGRKIVDKCNEKQFKRIAKKKDLWWDPSAKIAG